MNMPGFAAESSLGGVSHTFWSEWKKRSDSGVVEPALVCNPDCLDNCLMDCSDCDDLPNAASRARCRSFCIRHNFGCRRQCCR
jgi:hypothetical protein